MKEEIEQKLIQIKFILDSNTDFWEGYKKLITETQELIFKESCLKPHLNRCEPEFCSFRILGECQYFEQLGKLNSLIQL